MRVEELFSSSQLEELDLFNVDPQNEGEWTLLPDPIQPLPRTGQFEISPSLTIAFELAAEAHLAMEAAFGQRDQMAHNMALGSPPIVQHAATPMLKVAIPSDVSPGKRKAQTPLTTPNTSVIDDSKPDDGKAAYSAACFTPEKQAQMIDVIQTVLARTESLQSSYDVLDAFLAITSTKERNQWFKSMGFEKAEMEQLMKLKHNGLARVYQSNTRTVQRDTPTPARQAKRDKGETMDPQQQIQFHVAQIAILEQQLAEHRAKLALLLSQAK